LQFTNRIIQLTVKVTNVPRPSFTLITTLSKGRKRWLLFEFKIKNFCQKLQFLPFELQSLHHQLTFCMDPMARFPGPGAETWRTGVLLSSWTGLEAVNVTSITTRMTKSPKNLLLRGFIFLILTNWIDIWTVRGLM